MNHFRLQYKNTPEHCCAWSLTLSAGSLQSLLNIDVQGNEHFSHVLIKNHDGFLLFPPPHAPPFASQQSLFALPFLSM